MPKLRTTVTLDERVLRAVRIKAARTGRRDSEVIEEALRRDLGIDMLDRIWESADLDEVSRTLNHPKLRSRVSGADAERFLALLAEAAESVPDPEGPPPVRSGDP